MSTISRFASTADTIETHSQALEIEYYGNWGGPGHGTEGAPVKDRLDAAYRDHDHGYGERGYFDVTSDQIYGVNTLGVLLDPKSSWDARLHGVGAVAIFGAIAPFSALVTTIWNPVEKFAKDLKEQGLGTAVKNLLVTRPLGILKEGVAAIAGAVGTAASTVGAGLSAVGNAVASGASAVGNAVSAGISAVGNFFGSLF